MKNDGGRSKNVGKQDVYQRPDVCVGEQTNRQPNVGQPPDVLHGKMAQEAPVFGSHGKAIMI
jgi:hypothetical protein